MVQSYVVEEATSAAASAAGGEGGGNKIVAFLSYYHLPSTVLGNDKHKMLNAVYSYYNAPGPFSLEQIMQDALILAKNEGADVFNALDLMDNGTVFKELKFGPGDGHLRYYLYNWACPAMPHSKMGLVLL